MESKRIHIPVMAEEIIVFLNELSRPFEYFLDGTFGRGGHTKTVLSRFPQVKILAVDRDDAAINYAQQNFFDSIGRGQIQTMKCNFADLPLQGLPEAFANGLDAILLDLGVSSPQFDDPERGFSFYHAGPLDMRMDQKQSTTAADLINQCSSHELEKLFREYGEIKRPGLVIKNIIHQRQRQKIMTTEQLAKLIERSVGWARKGKHPATTYFMALRIGVNQELENLRVGLQRLIQILRPGGRLLVITFHPLEDRMVKQFFKSCPLGITLTKKVIKPSRKEIIENVRSRSAQLRVFERRPDET